MISDSIYIKDWKIIILYDCTCEDINSIIEALRDIKCPNRYIKEAINNLDSCNLDIGLTYSNLSLKSSVIVINKTSSQSQLINTISHEYYHLICHLKKGLKINDEEELATLNGNLNMQSFDFIRENF